MMGWYRYRAPVERGVALVMVLWIVSLMTIMAGSYALSTQREAAILSHAHERAKAVALADGGISYAMLMMNLPDPKKRWQGDGRPYVWVPGEGARVHLEILDEGGRIDLNAVQEQTLRTILNMVLQEPERSDSLADAILDWRDPDDLKRMHGAESAEYRTAGLHQGPQNRNFLVLDELRSVAGMSGELYRKLLPWFTLYTGQDGLNPMKAPRELLLVLMGGDQAKVDSFLQQRMQGGGGQPFAPVTGINFNSVNDTAFTIVARTELNGQPVVEVKATVKRSPGATAEPFTYFTRKESGFSRQASDPD